MSFQTTRGKHAAPRQPRRLRPATRPACGPIPVAAAAEDAPVRPSMDLPDGHMAQRPEAPSPVYVGTVLERARTRYRKDDVVKVTGGIVHVGRRGIVAAAYGAGRPLVVEIDGGIVYLAEDDVRLLRRPVDGETEQFATVHVAVPVTVVGVEHADGTPVGYWLPGEDAPTLVIDAVSPAEASEAELAQYYADIAAEDAARPSTSMQDKLEYAAACAAAGNPLMEFEREIMGLPLDDDVVLMGGASR